MEKLVSVIMPAYNAGKWIAQSISSVINQTYKNWELIIVNDGSTDNTEEVMIQYAKEYADKIHIYRNEKNLGAATALNVAMSHAKGEYMCWLSADDLYFEEMIELSAKYLEEHTEFDACFSKFITINENGEMIQVWNPKKFIEQLSEENTTQPYRHMLLTGNAFHGCSVFGKRESFLKTGDFNVDFPYATDYEYWVRMGAYCKIGFLNETTVIGREYPGQTSKQGRNDIDAIKAFCNLAKDENVMRPLFEKSGEHYSREMVKLCFVQRMNFYIERNEELQALLNGFSEYVELLQGEKSV